MNLTLSIDEKILKRARQAARAMGKSVNQLVRDYLEQLTQTTVTESELEELRRLSGSGCRDDWKFNRDELHDRT